jgi:mannose-6-phosphate isomerase-like protein (cupin superfamily)
MSARALAAVLPTAPDAVAPDGSEVRLLLASDRASAAHFRLAAGATSVAVRHRTVDEIWYVVEGDGEMWLADGDTVQTVVLRPGVCVSIPCGAQFQFRAAGPKPLAAFGVTMPPWPGGGEAVASRGPWTATVAPGPDLADH